MKGLSLTPKRKEQLENQLKQTRDVRVYRRTLAVLEAGSGTPVSKIAHMLKVDRRSIDRWIEAYGQAYDPLSLWDEQRSGRPPRWTEECFAWLQALLEASPQEFDFFATSWTVPLLQEQLEQCLGERFSDETLRRALRQLGYVWKRGRYVLEPDPEREKKTPDPPKNPPIGTAQRPVGRRRDGSAAVPAVAGRLGPPRRSDAGRALGTECPSGRLRSDEPAHRHAVVPGP